MLKKGSGGNMDYNGNIKLERLAGLESNYYPQSYKDYLKEEAKEVLSLIKDAKRLLDVGCGSDACITDVAKSVKEYIGIDLDSAMLYNAKDKLSNFKKAIVKKLDVHKISQEYGKNYFDVSIALWNALGCMGDEQHFIDELAKVTKRKIILSLVEKGNLKERTKYYENLKTTYLVMDDGKETIASPLWGYSRAYSKEDIERYAKNAGLKVEQFIPLAKIGLLAVLSK